MSSDEEPGACLVTGDSEFATHLSEALAACSIAVSVVSACRFEVVGAGTRTLVLHNRSDQRDLESTFFALRTAAVAGTAATVVVCDLDLDAVTSGALATLVAASGRAWPHLNIILVSDRVEEERRGTACSSQESWKMESLAEIVRQCVAGAPQIGSATRICIGVSAPSAPGQLDIARGRQ